MKKSELIYNIDRAMENDQNAIEALYNYTYAGMYSLAYRLCHNKDAAEDILQESYIAAFSSLHTLRYKGEFWKWIQGIVINKWRDYSKSNVIFSDTLTYDSADEQTQIETPEMSALEKLEKEEKNAELRRLLNKLPENQRVCLILFYYEDMSVQEIARILDIPEGSVKSRLHYGRKRLKKILSGNDLFAGAALSGPIIVAEGGNADMLAKILAALETSANGSAAVIAAETVGGGILFKLGIGFISAAVAAGIIGVILLPRYESNPKSSVQTTAAATTTSVSVTTTSSTTTTSEQVTTTTTAPAKTVTFDCRAVDGGIMIEKYTGTSENVVVPDKIDGKKVVSIGSNSFKYCSVIKSVSIPGSVANIGDNAFRECKNLTSVTFHAGLNNIGDMAFLGCSALTNVKIPSSVQSIGIYAFAYCTSLNNAEISEGTSTVKYCAFYQCSALRRVVLPSTVSTIGKEAFEGTSSELVLRVKEGTYAYTYAIDNDFNFEFAD